MVDRSLVVKWDETNRVFWFVLVEICCTIEEYAKILGARCDTDSVISPPPNPNFKLRTSRTLGIKKSLLGTEDEPNECKRCNLSLLCNISADHDAYEKNKTVFQTSRDE